MKRKVWAKKSGLVAGGKKIIQEISKGEEEGKMKKAVSIGYSKGMKKL
ncbi:MAG: hypothetical protein ABF904_14425 [Ethanoligenens sp.]